MRIAGWTAKETTAEAYWSAPPEDLEDAYIVKDGRLREVWDVGIEKSPEGNIYLYGSWCDSYLVPPTTPIYYSPPERWA